MKKNTALFDYVIRGKAKCEVLDLIADKGALSNKEISILRKRSPFTNIIILRQLANQRLIKYSGITKKYEARIDLKTFMKNMRAYHKEKVSYEKREYQRRKK